MIKVYKLSQYKNIIYEIALILLIGLTPLLWFKMDNKIVIGHDAGYPLDPVSWTENRVYTWNESVNWGNDNSMALGTITIHAPEYLLAKAGLNTQVSQRLVFVYWASLIALSMYLLTSYITKSDKRYRVFRIMSSFLYLINFFVLQAWFIAERTKFSILIAIPLVLLFLFRAVKKKNWLLNSGMAAFCLTIFNGGGSAFTLYGGLFLILLVLFMSLISFFKSKPVKVAKIFLTFALFFLIFNLYWIAPQIYFSWNNYNNALNEFGGLEATIGWAKEISSNSSITNVIRLQGIPDWYNKDYHPYANTLFQNTFFQIISLIIPILAFLPLYLYRKNKEFKAFSKFLTILAVVSILFTTGMHMPFGIIYEFLLRYIPFFTTYRTPFYKFGYALWFAYSLLIALTLNYFSNTNLLTIDLTYRVKTRISKTTIPWRTITLIMTLIILVSYTSPYFSSKIFNWDESYTTRLSPPEYIYKYQDWAEKTQLKGTTLILPKLDESSLVDKYNWGYYSIQPLPSILSDKSILTNSLNLSATEDEKTILESIYLSLEKDINMFEKLVQLYNIDSILFRKDISDYNSAKKMSLEDIELKLKNLSIFIEKENWGEWILYTRTDLVDNIEVISDQTKIKTDEQLSYSLLQEITTNIDSKNFILSDDSQDSDVFVLGAENLSSITPSTNTMRFNSGAVENYDKLQIRRQNVESSSYILSVTKTTSGYEFELREPTIFINISGQTETIYGNNYRFTYEVGSLKYIALNEDIFELPKNIGSTYSKIGKFYTRGDTSLAIKFYADEPTIILDPSLPDNYDWASHLANCGGVTDQIEAKNKSIGVDNFVSIQADNSRACILYQLDQVTPDSILELSLDVQRQLGISPSICLLDKTENKDQCIVDRKYYDSGSRWTNYREIAKNASTSSSLVLHLYAESNLNKTISNYKDISITQYKLKDQTTIQLTDIFPNNEIIDIPLNNEVGDLEVVTEDAPLPLNTYPDIENGSFEENDWGNGDICGEYKDEVATVNASSTDDSTNGFNAINIEASAGTGCYRNEINNFATNKIYFLSIDYKHLTGDSGRICLLQLGVKDSCLPEIELLDNIEWQTYATFFKPMSFTERAVLHLYSDAGNYLTSNLYDNIEIKSVDNPFSFISLAKSKTTVSTATLFRLTTDLPAIKVIELPSKKTDQNIIYSQIFSDDWLLIEISQDKSTYQNLIDIVGQFLGVRKDQFSHEKTNLIFNSWELPNLQSKKLIIVHRPQIIYIFSLSISLLALFLFILTVYIRIIRKNLSRRNKQWVKAFGSKDQQVLQRFDSPNLPLKTATKIREP